MLPDVVVVDGESETRRHLSLALAPVGYRVVSFPDAQSALPEIKTAPPRLVIADLLLPGMDGFELFHEIRLAVGERVQLLCISGLEWGQIDLAEVLQRRFKARLLKKPFLKSELKELVGELIGPGPHRSSFSSEWRIGVDDATRVEELARDFETHVASLGLNRGRCSVRTPIECTVLVKRAGDWIQCGAKNLSAGGLFVELQTPDVSEWPRLDQTLEVSLETAPGSVLRARARVALRLPPDEARAVGACPGLGMEFLDLCDEDRRALDGLVRALRQSNQAELQPLPTDSDLLPVTWVLLVGIEAEELLRRPGFLHRQGMEIMSVSSIEAAADFLRVHSPALCVVHEGALGTEPARALDPLANALTGKRILVVGQTKLSSLVSLALCDAVLRPDTPMEILFEELSERLGVAQRRAPRVPAQAEVKVYGGVTECQANLINLSTGGMLLKSSMPAPVGTRIALDFDLPGAPGLRCDAVIVRTQPDHQGSAHLWGLSFSEVDENTSQALRRFVESHVHFRDFFSWLKTAYFTGRLEK
jgi:DNA-binding response OmpR family regulator